MKIDVYRNQLDTYFEFERNKYGKDETDNIITPNTSWFVLKPSMMDEKMNKYKLSQGEIIKLGRITMRIRDIIFEGKNKYNLNDTSNLDESIASNKGNINENINEMQTLKTEGYGVTLLLNNKLKNRKFRNKVKTFDNFDTKVEKTEKIKIRGDIKKNLHLFSKIEKKNKICRICYIQEEDPENNPLVQPCNCDGSLKFIHLQCLSQWIQTHSCEKLETNNNCSIYLIKPIECELCKSKFPDYIKLKNKFFPLINFMNEYNSYLTLESLTLDKYQNKFIYVVSLETNRRIPIGKNQNCEIILSDRSIESVHCFMIVSNKQVYLEDNDSKFGTLVLVQTNHLKLYQDIPLYLQIGRSFLEILVKKEFKLFDCCGSGDKNNIFTYYEQNEKYIKNDVSLVVKNEDEESESYVKNNNTQEVQLYDYGNNSLNIGNKDKMSDNEYLQIKRSKRNKNIKKNIYNEITLEPKDEEQNDNELKIEINPEEENVEKKSKNEDNESSEIKIESEDTPIGNKIENFVNSNEINNLNENNEENKKNESKIEENNNNKSLIDEEKNINEINKEDIINEIKSVESIQSIHNIQSERNLNILKEDMANLEIKKENEINNLNESKKTEIKQDVSILEI